jgi:hypothetical protein
MTARVFALDTLAGIQRDGTIFDKAYYTDGVWCRFQRGRPRKMGGFRQIINNLSGPSRGMYVNPQQAFTNIFSGYANGLQRLPVNEVGVGSGLNQFTLTGFTASNNNMWQFDMFTDTAGSGDTYLLAHPGQNLALVDNNTNTPVLGGLVSGLSASPIGVFTDSATTTNGSSTVVLAAANFQIGAGQKVTGTGIPANTFVVSVSTTNVVLSNNATASGTVTLTFDNQVSVSGGVVVLHPYVFVYGNNGLIKNCSAGNFNDWVSADANEVNVATGKIVQGLAVRGGSNAPSGLFWSLDSLIRVSFVGGAGSPPQFWRYDIISTQSSIMSSQCVIEYDGVYYWCGVDRFLLYNGVVKEIPNNMNQNYFFDNINYAQRQKVFVSKVPRFGEIWWFYPRGDSIECNDAIIYNVRENTWYDAGLAVGARRSAGYFSQVFHYPVNADSVPNLIGVIDGVSIVSPGSGYTNGTYTGLAVVGGSGSGATIKVVVSGGAVTSVTIELGGHDYEVGDSCSAVIPGGSSFSFSVSLITSQVTVWQHELGVDKITGSSVMAIESAFETNDLGFVSGGPSQPSPVGDNVWLRLERVEPDFLLTGEMEMYVTGRPFAQAEDYTSEPYVFDQNTNKIDMREQRRELRLRFVSNVQGGNYQLGKLLLNADTGDVRGY